MAECEVCGKPIMVSIFKGTGKCSEICRKKKEGDTPFNSGQS